MILFSIEILYLAGKKVYIREHRVCTFCIFHDSECKLNKYKHFLCGVVIKASRTISGSYIEENFI